ncbi:MAG: hypothetical protein ACTS44_01825, partial [Candidatus Hodgkinia cicadicola]
SDWSTPPEVDKFLPSERKLVESLKQCNFDCTLRRSTIRDVTNRTVLQQTEEPSGGILRMLISLSLSPEGFAHRNGWSNVLH